MASTAFTAHLPALGEHVREEAGAELQATLVELIDLALVGKQLHWSIVGPRFNPLHQRLDELVEAWHELADTVAERAVAIGHAPDGQADAIVGAGDRSPVERGAVEDHAVLEELVNRLNAVAEHVRERMARLGALDIASQDVLVGVVRALEEQLWMSRAQLP